MAAAAEVAEMVFESENTAVLTGAGISVASGATTFRGQDGERYDTEASRWAYRKFFDQDPATWYESYWQFYNQIRDLAPSAGHFALRDMVEEGVVDTIITQNVDGLDLLAGTPADKVIEVHGHNRSLSCANRQDQDCGFRIPMECWLADHDQTELPLCAEDGDVLKPDMMLIEDTYVPPDLSRAHHEDAPEALQAADTLLVVGTSLYIVPWQKAALWFAAREDRSLVIINPQPGALDEYAQAVLSEPAEEALPQIRDLVLG